MSTGFCSACGDVIGVYEPVVAVYPGHVRITSLLNEPALVGDDQAQLYHAACHRPLKPTLPASPTDVPRVLRPNADA